MMHQKIVSCLLMLVLQVGSTSAVKAQEIDSCNDPEASSMESVPQIETSPLELAHNLNAPHATDTLDAEYEHASFWDDNGPLLQQAWEEWEMKLEEVDPFMDDHGGFVEASLSKAIHGAFLNPSEETESRVRSLWKDESDDGKALPKGVYAAQLLTASHIVHIRWLLDTATSSGIPTRRPNGMNRHGVIVDPNVYGAVPVKSLVRWVDHEIINHIVRPVGRMLYPDRIGPNDDIEYFAFTIRYDGSDDNEDDTTINGDRDESKPKRDFELKEHRDASIVTLNINLNLPEEGYAGSEVYFREYPSEEDSTDSLAFNNEQEDPQNDMKDGGTVGFSPGMAIIHLGAHRHGSLPISPSSSSKNGGGKRYNLVIWLFGKDGDVRIAPYEEQEQMNVVERWNNSASHINK